MRIHTFKYIINNWHFYLKKIELDFPKEQITVKDDMNINEPWNTMFYLINCPPHNFNSYTNQPSIFNSPSNSSLYFLY